MVAGEAAPRGMVHSLKLRETHPWKVTSGGQAHGGEDCLGGGPCLVNYKRHYGRGHSHGQGQIGLSDRRM